ncbi:hypothetical protein ASPZODRAFT_17253 [Penicilliopsis zonata CBS 506.65]|uniref:Epidermal growth factor receptor-like transmembrane-juxtamembrane segment domain-containing protein n=1 Tax=Penicilliopsis zonata CBS 506.65 TaxID=1073090 RepID=A0A1L9SF42_9EURO|nr:hypothetical protein ASPZODRAFT_17253 [Penicilliopsis zonata CBS 506.65]OJJ45816.1 hypothetical protein ASPZODRAFT_17253 [Penicilliopsis zonata CBS 506.65]
MRGLLFVRPLIGALLLAALPSVIADSCYDSDGDLASSNVACSDDGNVTWCCSDGYYCMSNRLCEWQTGDFYQGTCTDETWESSECPNICGDDGNPEVWECSTSEGTFCCGGTDGSCCDNSTEIITLGQAMTIGYINNGTLSVMTTSSTTTTSTGSTTSSSVTTTTGDTSTTVTTTTSTSTTGTPTNTSGSTGGGNSGGSSSSDTGAIAGGVVGGVAGLAALAVLAWFLWRRNRQKTHKTDLSPNLQRAELSTDGNYHSVPQMEHPQELESVHLAGSTQANTLSASDPSEVDARDSTIYELGPSR